MLFIFYQGTGVLYIIGQTLFEDVFHVKRRRNMTLAVAIDYTASMTDDIAAVKTKVIELLTNTVGSSNEPADYVLSLFHDPGRPYIYCSTSSFKLGYLK